MWMTRFIKSEWAGQPFVPQLFLSVSTSEDMCFLSGSGLNLHQNDVLVLAY